MMFRALAPLLAAAAFAAPASAQSRHPIEPVPIPPSIKQGVDLIYVDPEIAPAVRERDAFVQTLGSKSGWALRSTCFRRSARSTPTCAAASPAIVPPGPASPRSRSRPAPRCGRVRKGERVALLRQRLGLSPSDTFGEDLTKAVRRFQQVHGIKADGIAGEGTISSLNLGSDHYERLVMLNMERARRLPGTTEQGPYILIDVGSARLMMFDQGQARRQHEGHRRQGRPARPR
jgi:hypothetical protein